MARIRVYIVHAPRRLRIRVDYSAVIGQTISHYKILEKLGEGGMGIVYKAEDLRLQRLVALKFLPAKALGSADAKARFFREARAAAALNHPNICTVYEIDEVDGQTFIAMAYLEGRELTAVIGEGPLDVERLIDFGIQMAEGLEEAHSNGTVHRDIKPANVMVTTKGRPVVMDFGLAQLTSAASKLTREGTTVGTSAYMSPEQTLGDKTDHRTDIWALGVVLYEMATGRLPFEGLYEQAILYSILHEQPDAITDLRTGVPVELERIVNKCLAKKAEERYETIGHLAADLRALRQSGESRPARRSSSAVKELRPSIVILPFQNRGRDEEEEYFSDGVTEDVITALGKLKGLRVIPRASAFHFKGKRPQLHEIVEALDVGHVLEGSIRRAGDRVRITVELVDAVEGDQIWTERYDRVLEDIFDVQDEIAQAIASQLKIELISKQRLVEKPTSNEEAYQLYLRGRHLIYRLTGDSMQKGLDLVKQARQLDPDFVQAYAAESFGYMGLTILGWTAPGEALKQGKSLAVKAIEMDDSLAEAHLYYGMAVMWADWDWPGAEAALRRAVDLNPESPDARSWLAELLVLTGRLDEALSEARRACELDPLSVEANRSVALVQLYRRDYEACVDSCRLVLDLDAQYPLSYGYLGFAQCFAGSVDAALETLRKACDSLAYDPLLHAWFGYVLGRAGKHDEARKILAGLRARGEKGLPSSWLIASVDVGLGENDEALGAYEDSVEGHEGVACYTGFPMFDPIRDDPRFHALRRRMNLEK